MSTVKHIDTNGLLYYSTLIRQALAGKADVGAEANLIEAIRLAGESSDLTITSKRVVIPDATSSASGLLTSTEKTKLSGIESGAEVNVLEAVKLEGASSDLTISSKKVTIPKASSSADGIMVSSDYTKLSGVATGAQVNVIESIKLEDASGDLTITSKKVTIPKATTSADGIMTSTDKTKLNGVATGAQVNVLEAVKLEGASSDLAISSKKVTIPKATSSKDGIITSTDYTKLSGIATGAQVNVIESVKIDDTALTVSSKAVNIPLASASVNGAMSSTDYSKLSGVASGAQVNVIEGIKLDGAGSNLTPASKVVTIPNATTSSNGLMTASDKTALNGAAPLASPTFTGTPAAPTAASGTNTTQIATTAFVQSAISAAITGRFKFVSSLPSTGEVGYIYLVPHTHSGSSTNTNPDVKDEYIWNDDATQWELIGNTDIDLSNYWNTTDLVTATNAEVLACWEDSASS